jgi:hypothetical protein
MSEQFTRQLDQIAVISHRIEIAELVLSESARGWQLLHPSEWVNFRALYFDRVGERVAEIRANGAISPHALISSETKQELRRVLRIIIGSFRFL